MDTALILQMKIDCGQELDVETIDDHLYSSELVKAITREFSESSLYPVWRLIALSEIPYAGRLEYTQKLVEYVEHKYSTPCGFSISSKSEDLLPCYNAMIAEALSKLGYGNRSSVRCAIAWIKNYQVFNREETTTWNGAAIKKYGGCMQSTPCYIGVAKSVKALIYHNESSILKDHKAEKMVEKGTEYLLQHHLFQRLSDRSPITNHILDLAFPPSYQLNIVELLEIGYKTNNMNDPRVNSAISYLAIKGNKDSGWRSNYVYKGRGYVNFDKRRQKAEWITYFLGKYLSQVCPNER